MLVGLIIWPVNIRNQNFTFNCYILTRVFFRYCLIILPMFYRPKIFPNLVVYVTTAYLLLSALIVNKGCALLRQSASTHFPMWTSWFQQLRRKSRHPAELLIPAWSKLHSRILMLQGCEIVLSRPPCRRTRSTEFGKSIITICCMVVVVSFFASLVDNNLLVQGRCRLSWSLSAIDPPVEHT